MVIKQAIIPVAGRGTRFYPATLASPKEMLPVINKPLIQYVVEELIDAGVTEIYFVINSQKKNIEEHFDAYFSRDLSAYMAPEEQLRIQRATFTYLRQPQALGLGHAIWCAKHVVNHEPFFVVLPDEFLPVMPQSSGCIHEMIKQYDGSGDSVIALQEVSANEIDRYGIADIESKSVKKIIEKPAIGSVRSRSAVIGRYLLTAQCMDVLSNYQYNTAGGEIQLTPCLDHMAKEGSLSAVHYQGKRFDCGQTEGFLRANIFMAESMNILVNEGLDGFILY